jgi:hypothetical protein
LLFSAVVHHLFVYGLTKPAAQHFAGWFFVQKLLVAAPIAIALAYHRDALPDQERAENQMFEIMAWSMVALVAVVVVVIVGLALVR